MTDHWWSAWGQWLAAGMFAPISALLPNDAAPISSPGARPPAPFSIFNRLADGVFCATADGTIVYTNGALAMLLGYSSASALVGRPASAIDAHFSAQLQLQRDRGDGQGQEYTSLYRCRDGQSLTAEVCLYPFDDLAAVASAQVWAVVRDGRERLRAARELAQMSMVAQATENAAIVADASGCVEWANASFTRMTGYGPAEAIGRNLEDLVNGPVVTSEQRSALSAALHRQQTYRGERCVATKTGKSCWLQLVVNPIRDDSGALTHFVAIATAIDSFKRQQQQAAAIAEVVAKMRASLDWDTILQTTVNRLRGLLACDRVAIYQFAPDWSGGFIAEAAGKQWVPLVPSVPLPDSTITALAGPVAPGCVLRLLAENITLTDADPILQDARGGSFATGQRYDAVDDVLAGEVGGGQRERFARHQVRAYVRVPVFASGRLWGFLAAYQNDGPRAWRETDVEALLSLAEPLGIALQQAQMYRQLQASEERYTLAVRGSGNGLWDWDTQDNRAYYAPRFGELLGYGEAELPQDFSLLQESLHPDDRDGVLAALYQHFEDRSPWDVECRLRGKDGRYFWAHVRGQAIWDAEGKPTRMAGSIDDITRRKEAEFALREARDQLAARAAELDRLNRQLQAEIELSQRLERSNRELQDFAHVASHDLQEPLRKIQAFGDRIRTKYSDRLDAKGQDYIARMLNAARRAQLLIDDLLDFSRVSTHAQPFARVDLNAVVVEAIQDLDVAIESTNARIDWDELPAIDADPRQLRQLFQNLLGNALKYRREGVAPVARIQAQIVDWHGQPACQLAITDNGIGFDNKYAERIFIMFRRLHDRSSYEGTGIGLAICRKIVERHGGTIAACGIPGEGATFTITLPVTQDGDEPRESP